MSTLPSAIPLVSRLHRAAAFLARIPSDFAHRAALTRSRRGLLRLDDHLLRDIGLSRSAARAEAERPAWDAPSHWKG